MKLLFNWWEITDERTFLDYAAELLKTDESFHIDDLDFDLFNLLNKVFELSKLNPENSNFTNLHHNFYLLLLKSFKSIDRPSKFKEIIECLELDFPAVYLNSFDRLNKISVSIINRFVNSLSYSEDDNADDLHEEIECLEFLLDKKFISNSLASNSIDEINNAISFINSFKEEDERNNYSKPVEEKNLPSEISDAQIFNLFSSIS